VFKASRVRQARQAYKAPKARPVSPALLAPKAQSARQVLRQYKNMTRIKQLIISPGK
jgi:hypothetical protein